MTIKSHCRNLPIFLIVNGILTCASSQSWRTQWRTRFPIWWSKASPSSWWTSTVTLLELKASLTKWKEQPTVLRPGPSDHTWRLKAPLFTFTPRAPQVTQQLRRPLFWRPDLCLLWLVSPQVSPRQPSLITTASSPFWLFCHHMASRLTTSSTSTCLCTTQLDFLSALLAPLRQVRWC